MSIKWFYIERTTYNLELYWSPWPESNRRPPPYHGGALPTELHGHVFNE